VRISVRVIPNAKTNTVERIAKDGRQTRNREEHPHNRAPCGWKDVKLFHLSQANRNNALLGVMEYLERLRRLN